MASIQQISVSISDMKASKDPNVYLVTHSLGSCIGLVVYDPLVKAAALLHLQLPDSKGHERRAQENPFMFADTGIPLLLKSMNKLHAQRNNLVVSMFGGANMLDDNELFKIGIKNARATKKILWQHAIPIRTEDVGGRVSRTVGINIGTGKVTLKKSGQVFEL